MKQRDSAMAVNDSPQECRPPGPGELQEDAGAHMHCAGGWGWGEASPTEGRGTLCSHFYSCILFCLPAERKKKEKKEKKSFLSFGGGLHVNATFRRYPCRFCLVFSQVRPGVAVARVTHKCVLVPVCFLGYFTKLVGTVISSKKKERRKVTDKVHLRKHQTLYQ
ncbi:unnamed protein product [Rangifer tarandus platyrhynchus]|uniref:Uncharacterized protein n=1 Tax=Rangifer tarandus platyrhynchus TaxID=3082113 RepID=A0ABN8XWP0_RANTA|nr:unnamed protein product [Rangifer tarandus platyrhynchus]